MCSTSQAVHVQDFTTMIVAQQKVFNYTASVL